MSSLIVKVCPIDKVLPHSNADKLEIAHIGGWQVICKKDEYRIGDLTIFVPPDSVLPQDLIDKHGVASYLATGNRVKAVKLRGEKSFGLLLKPENGWREGQDVAGTLGITKWEPPPPTQGLAGSGSKTQQAKRHPLWQRYTEIENVRHYRSVLSEDEQVVCVEKCHGCNVSISMLNGELVVSSHNYNRQPPCKYTERKLNWIQRQIRNLGRRFNKNWLGPICEIDEAGKVDDWYWHATTIPGVLTLLQDLAETHKQVILYGECFGRVQKGMNYGSPEGLKFAAFDLLIDGKYLDYDAFALACATYHVPRLPVIYRGLYRFETIMEIANGNTMIDGAPSNQIREGIVVRPVKERNEPRCGRVIFKAINDDYLMKQYTKDAVGDQKDE